MQKEDEELLSAKSRELDSAALVDYIANLKLVGIKCPYGYHESVWKWGRDSFPDTPSIHINDLFSYLVLARNSITFEQFRAYKSLESYQHVVQGYVGSFGIFKVNSSVSIIMAKVSHSRSLNIPPANPWVAVKPCGYVVCSHCDCVAGLGSVCTHVGATLFAAEYQAKIIESKSCTETKCSWLDTYQKPDPCKLLTELTPLKRAPISRVPSIPPADVNAFRAYARIKLTKERTSVFLSTFGSFAKNYAPKFNLPRPLGDLFNPSLIGKPVEFLIEEGARMMDRLKLTKEQITEVENATRGQALSTDWHEQRQGRITASVIKSVMTTTLDNPSNTVVNQICHPHTIRKGKSNREELAALRWGRDSEGKAVASFQKALLKQGSHPGFSISECGLFISQEHPYIAASPDRLFSCPCHGPGVIECKAPYSCRNLSVAKAAENKNFCLGIDPLNGELFLKPSHEYYFQVQTQMFTTETLFCFFLVWTQVDMQVCFIDFDPIFFESVKHRCTAAFKFVILPELLSDCFSQTRHRTSLAGDTLICFCREVKKDAKVIRCATGKEKCQVYEFHEECVLKKKNLKRITNRWRCDSCKSAKNQNVLKDVNK